jgi:prepilin peptidase CpaA
MNITPDLYVSAPLLGLLCAAAWHDVKSFRIPNYLTGAGLALGLSLNSVLPEGLGFFSSLLGLTAGLFGLLPLYLLRIWGAGDVKLMAVVGAFLGPVGLAGSLILTLLAGGATALAVACARRNGGLLFQNLQYMVYQFVFHAQTRSMQAIEGPARSAGKVAYGIPILLGTAAYLLYRDLA